MVQYQYSEVAKQEINQMNVVLYGYVSEMPKFSNLHGVARDADGNMAYLTSVAGANGSPEGFVLSHVASCVGAAVVFTNPDSKWGEFEKLPLSAVDGFEAWWAEFVNS